MKLVKIIKIADYDPTMNGRYSLYQGYCLSSRRLSQPHITITEHPAALGQGVTVLCSSLTRGKETALLLSPQPRSINLLDEICFDLSQLLSEQEFTEYGSGRVREKFLAAFINDSLMESRADIIKRVRSLLSYLSSIPQNDIFCISHSFFMKVLEAYIEADGQLETHPELLANFISIKDHTYPYMEGFEFKL